MNPRELTELETALGLSEPLPWPNSQAEEIELVRLTEPRGPTSKPTSCGPCREMLNLPEHDLPPTARRGEREVARIHKLLDELQTEGQVR
jgi:hypothetical protein